MTTLNRQKSSPLCAPINSFPQTDTTTETREDRARMTKKTGQRGKMLRIFAILQICLLLFPLYACGSKDAKAGKKGEKKTSVLGQVQAQETEKPNAKKKDKAAEKNKKKTSSKKKKKAADQENDKADSKAEESVIDSDKTAQASDNNDKSNNSQNNDKAGKNKKAGAKGRNIFLNPEQLKADFDLYAQGKPIPKKPEKKIVVQKKVDLGRQGEGFSLLFAGDMRFDTTILTGSEKPEGGYDFRPIFTQLKNEVSPVDYALCNFVGTIAGEPYQGEGTYSAPPEVALALKEAGFDGAATATHHAMDSGAQGLVSTVEALQDAGMDVIGTRADDKSPEFLFKELGGIKTAIADYTYETDAIAPTYVRSLNGIPIPADIDPYVDSFTVNPHEATFLANDEAEIKQRVEKMRKSGAELIIFVVHWGQEYQTAPNDMQKYWAQVLANLDVDVILGTGPRSVQPIEIIRNEHSDHKTLVYYSVGNGISATQFDADNNNGYAEDGILALTRFERNKEGKVGIASASYLPIYSSKVFPGENRTLVTPIPTMAALDNPGQYNMSNNVKLLQLSLERVKKIMKANRTPGLEVTPLAKVPSTWSKQGPAFYFDTKAAPQADPNNPSFGPSPAPDSSSDHPASAAPANSSDAADSSDPATFSDSSPNTPADSAQSTDQVANPSPADQEPGQEGPTVPTTKTQP